MILLRVGLRVSELVNLKLSDIDFLTREVAVFSKGGKLRTIPLREDVITSIKDYMEQERNKSRFVESEYLLVSNRSPKMDRDAVARRVKKMGKVLNIRIYPHMLRHTMATNLCKNSSINISTVAQILGHKSIQVTHQYYVNISTE